MYNNKTLNIDLNYFLEITNKIAKEEREVFPNKMFVNNIFLDSSLIEKEIKRLSEFRT